MTSRRPLSAARRSRWASIRWRGAERSGGPVRPSSRRSRAGRRRCRGGRRGRRPGRGVAQDVAEQVPGELDAAGADEDDPRHRRASVADDVASNPGCDIAPSSRVRSGSMPRMPGERVRRGAREAGAPASRGLRSAAAGDSSRWLRRRRWTPPTATSTRGRPTAAGAGRRRGCASRPAPDGASATTVDVGPMSARRPDAISHDSEPSAWTSAISLSLSAPSSAATSPCRRCRRRTRARPSSRPSARAPTFGSASSIAASAASAARSRAAAIASARSSPNSSPNKQAVRALVSVEANVFVMTGTELGRRPT